MVFEHQMHMINLLTRYGWEVRYALWSSQAENSGSIVFNLINLEDALGELVDYMLFVNEPEFQFPVTGSSGFSEKFEGRGPRDGLGRSLRQFDLGKRLMHYPLSYMIYTHAFDGLPVEARNAIYARLWQVLSGMDRDPRYDRLSPEDRQAIIEILQVDQTRPARLFQCGALTGPMNREITGDLRPSLQEARSGARWHNLVEGPVAYIVDEAGDDQLVWHSGGLTESFDVVLH